MGIWSYWFGLTSPPAPPNGKDISKMKAIEERIDAMDKTFNNVFTITETKGASNWVN